MTASALAAIKERCTAAICPECHGLGRLPSEPGYSVLCTCNDGRSINGEYMSSGQFVRYCLALVAEVERLQRIAEAAKKKPWITRRSGDGEHDPDMLLCEICGAEAPDPEQITNPEDHPMVHADSCEVRDIDAAIDAAEGGE